MVSVQRCHRWYWSGEERAEGRRCGYSCESPQSRRQDELTKYLDPLNGRSRVLFIGSSYIDSIHVVRCHHLTVTFCQELGFERNKRLPREKVIARTSAQLLDTRLLPSGYRCGAHYCTTRLWRAGGQADRQTQAGGDTDTHTDLHRVFAWCLVLWHFLPRLYRSVLFSVPLDVRRRRVVPAEEVAKEGGEEEGEEEERIGKRRRRKKK